MPNWVKFVGGWAIASVVAIAFSWGAVSQVRNRVIQPSIELPTTVAAAAATNPPPTPTTAAASPTVIRVEPEIVGDTATTQPATDATSTTTTTPTTTAQPNGATTTTTSAPAATTTTAPTTTTQPPPTSTSTTTTSTTAPSQVETSSYQLTGGTVTISHSPGVVTFVSAIPQPDFSTDLRETGPERVRVRFESESQTSDFRAEWDSGELKITQNETGED